MNPLYRFEKLSIFTPDGKAIIKNQTLEIFPNDIILLLGKSGAGKSTLAKVIAGVITPKDPFAVSGFLKTGSGKIDLSKQTLAAARYIFQNYAVFDDLSIGNNLQIVADHAGAEEMPEQALINALIGEFRNRPVHACSGGQKLRVAIARTLYASHHMFLYDEPNSGLDPSNAKRLAAVVQSITQSSGSPSIVIAHHYEIFLPISTRVLVFDNHAKKLIPLATEKNAIAQHFREPLPEYLGTHRLAAPSTSPSHKHTKHLVPRWFLHYFTHYFQVLMFTPGALLYMAVCGLLVGLVSTWFLFQYFPYREYLAPLLGDDMLSALGFVQFRVLVPVFTCILLASRNGALISADLGHRVNSFQTHAMKNLGIPHRIYLVGNCMLTMILASLFFVVANFVLCAWATQWCWRLLHPGESVVVWHEFYFARILSEVAMPEGWTWVVAKTLLSGIAIAAFGCRFGSTPKKSVLDLNTGIAKTIIWSTSTVLIIHSVITLLEFHQ